jgi:hypothetical protein
MIFFESWGAEAGVNNEEEGGRVQLGTGLAFPFV